MSRNGDLLADIRKLSQKQPAIFIGLDGFIDRIIRVVDKRFDNSHCSYVPTLSEYGRRISDASGLSLNVEIVSEKSQLGGNGPIMAQACARLGAEVTCLGAFGVPDLVQEFEPLAKEATLLSVTEPARTDAWEFDDGKIIASQLSPLNKLTWDTILAHVSETELCHIFSQSDLIALNNWTMIPAMTEIWAEMRKRIFQFLTQRERILFFDLADPSKRMKQDLLSALLSINEFAPFGKVLLSCNKREILQIAEVLECDTENGNLLRLAKSVCMRLGIWAVAIHTLTGSCMAGEEMEAEAEGFYTEKPLISVGGGDHFNAGLAWSLLRGFPWDKSLLMGSAVSGYYVRTGMSPTTRDIESFLEHGFI